MQYEQLLCVMTVSNTRVIDLLGVDKTTGNCTLTITDHLEWSDQEHLLVLQEKINTYLVFIESGEILEQYPEAKKNPIRINVVMLHEPTEEATNFLKQASIVISGAGFSFTWEVFRDDA